MMGKADKQMQLIILNIEFSYISRVRYIIGILHCYAETSLLMIGLQTEK